MAIARLTTIEEWESLSADWGSLARGNPFASWEWLSAWWRHYGPGRELCVLAVHDEDARLMGAAPWYRTTSAARGVMLATLGSGEACTDYVFLLSRPGAEARVARSVCQWLVQRHDRVGDADFHWDVLAFECVPESDEAAGHLVEGLARSGCAVQRQPAAGCWSIPLPGTWEEYLAELSKSHRKQIKRALRGWWEAGRAQLRIVPRGEDPRPDFDLLASLHTRRWQSQGGGGVFASPRFASFLADATERLHRCGGLQLSVLELDGRPAAADLHFVSAEGSYAYQGGIEPELAEESPGRLLTALLIRDAITSGRAKFDFLRGDEPYKLHFRAVRTATHHVQIVPPCTTSQLRHRIWTVGTTVKRLVKSGILRTSGP